MAASTLMRVLLIALVACGGSTPIERLPPPKPYTRHGAAVPAPVDVIATLAQTPTKAATIVPGSAQLLRGGPMLDAESSTPVDVDILEERGRDVRVGVRLEHARFAIWMPRERMLLALSREVQLSQIGRLPAFGADAVEVALHAGAQVQWLVHKGDQIQVRYIGALDATGWVPSDAVGELHAATRPHQGRVPKGRTWQMVTPGVVIRSEPKWTGSELAVVEEMAFLDQISAIDDTWIEVAYEDDDIKVHGYLSKHAPPAGVHHPPRLPAPPPLFANATAPDRTCIYLDDEQIGFLVGDQPVVLEASARAGWSWLTIDTPWGPIAFAARGESVSDLERCGH